MTAQDVEVQQMVKSLAYIAVAVTEFGNENKGLTDYMIAKGELKNFADAVDKVVNKIGLDPEPKEGLIAFIDYLGKKIDKRISQSSQY